MNSLPCRSRAFTLIELLVVISIIGVLIALLLPAVQAARESARRTQCTNNLKQLALAVHGYATDTNVLPSHTMETGWFWGGNHLPNWGASWTAALLPYMEQQVMYSALNFSLPILEMSQPLYLANTTVGLTSIQTLLCPSESMSKAMSFNLAAFETNQLFVQLAATNYAGNYGGPAMIKAWSGTIIPTRGPADRLALVFLWMFSSGQTPPATCGPVRIQAITDGTSTTALFSERQVAAGTDMGHVPPPSAVVGGPDAKRALFQTSMNVLIDQKDTAAAQNYVAACKALPGGTYPKGAPVAQWLPSVDFSTLSNAYSHVMTPNGLSCTGADDPSNAVCTWLFGGIGSAVTATSNHPGGVNVAFCDGSVKFVKDTIAQPTWWALGTRDGREVISADAY